MPFAENQFQGWLFHGIAEILAFAVGIYLYSKRKKDKSLNQSHSLYILAYTFLFAFLGSKILSFLQVNRDLNLTSIFSNLISGKTIVGGLIGGWIGVELAKHQLGLKESTGDRLVFPLVLGITIGRLGCFFAGTYDGTYGLETSSVLGMDYGDGLLRHPTQLYEILVVWILLPISLLFPKHPPGIRFRVFIAGYFLFRLCIEELKLKSNTVFGLTPIQIAALTAILFSVYLITKLKRISFDLRTRPLK